MAYVSLEKAEGTWLELLQRAADGEEVDVMTKGRHDPCVGIRAVPVAEAMLACVLADAKLRDRGQVGRQS